MCCAQVSATHPQSCQIQYFLVRSGNQTVCLGNSGGGVRLPDDLTAIGQA
jgi:hypothetical protein